jgi:hypothetical protein
MEKLNVQPAEKSVQRKVYELSASDYLRSTAMQAPILEAMSMSEVENLQGNISK